jgi:hypothetical protein
VIGRRRVPAPPDRISPRRFSIAAQGTRGPLPGGILPSVSQENVELARRLIEAFRAAGLAPADDL